MSLTATAPAASAAPRDLDREGVGGDRHAGTRASPSIAGTSAAASSSAGTGGPLRAATAPTSSISKPASASAIPSATACSGVPLRAPSNIESTVTLTIPAAIGCARSRVLSASRQRHAGYRSDRADGAALRLHRPRRDPARAGAARCSATPRAASRWPRRAALEACHRAGVEVVIMSGRREPQVARGGAADGPDLLHLRGRLRLRDRRRDDADDRRDGARRGAARSTSRSSSAASRSCSSSTSRAGSSTTRPGTTAASSPTSSAARSTSRRPTRCSASSGHDDLRLLDNGAIGREMPAIEGPTHAYHLVPQHGQQGERGRRPRPRPRLRPAPTASRSATRSRTSRSPPRSAASSSSPTAPSATPACAPRSPAGTTSPSPRAAMGDGFYEAVVSTLVERR